MEWRLFYEDDPPVWADPATTVAWHADREHAPHIDQGIHQPRMYAAARMVLAHGGVADKVVDLGAGDGGMLQWIKQQGWQGPLWGYDLQPSNIHAAEARGVHVLLRDVVNSDDWVSDPGSIFICTEFLEHLVDPHGFVRRLYARLPSLFVASSPVNESDASHYAHHTWAWDREGYDILMEQGGFTVVDSWSDGIFQVVACKRT